MKQFVVIYQDGDNADACVSKEFTTSEAARKYVEKEFEKYEGEEHPIGAVWCFHICEVLESFRTEIVANQTYLPRRVSS